MRPLHFSPNPLPIAVKEETTLTTYLVGPEAEISGGRSDAGTVIEETKTNEVFQLPQPPAPPQYIPPPPPQNFEVVRDTKIVETRSPSPRPRYHPNPIIVDGGRPREESTFVERKREVYEQSDPIPVGPLALAAPAYRSSRDERAIRDEIKALEAEKEALRIQRRAEKELRKADRIRRSGRASETDLVLYEQDTYDRRGEEVTLVRREKVSEPEGGVRIEKDRKGRMSINVPKYIR